jgi:hypothetical protein
VVFRITDLIRSKFQCSESTFTNVLKTLYLLDDKLDELEFKIVRIKNKLDENDNNIIINFKFLGKIICELQLSAQQCSKK